MLIIRRRQLEMVLTVLTQRYNSHWSHRPLDQAPPLSMAPASHQPCTALLYVITLDSRT
jgi:hypothetical protein